LVTGAEEHQGLAVIRGLGRAGWNVIACGARRHSIGFASRFASASYAYASAASDPNRFFDDLMRVVRATHPALIVPSVETTLVVLNERREEVERHVRLAAPPPATLEFAIDKARTLQLAARLGVPIPATVCGASCRELLYRARALTFPVAVKPRGHRLHASTANGVRFKSYYAESLDALAELLEPLEREAPALLVQEYAPGVGRCVAAVCRDGVPLSLFAYERDREFPLSGGVSVVRRSIPLDDRLLAHVCALLGAVAWQGVAMVEFKYDARADRYRLMEINGRFQASTALSLAAGLNLPHLAACVFLGIEPPRPTEYRVGVYARWLRGDLMALRDAFTASVVHATPDAGRHAQDRRRRAVSGFIADTFRGVHYDEVTPDDWHPAIVEAASLAALLARWTLDALRSMARRVLRYRIAPALPRQAAASASARPAAQRSIRA
jgi:predicted ATP-grasp superfamily ATP-dependent carboligase